MFKRFLKRMFPSPAAAPDPGEPESGPAEPLPEAEEPDLAAEGSAAGTEEAPASDADPGDTGSPPDARPTPLEVDLDAPRPVSDSWRALGDRPPGELSDARLQLHHLVQILAAFGGTFTTPEDDDSHRTVTWSPSLGGFRSREAELAGNVFMVVRPLPLEVQIRAVGDVHRYMLPGHTLQEAWDWAERELASILGRFEVELERPEFEIPDHRVTRHALFDASPSALDELSRWFDNALLILNRVRRECPEAASAVRSWPHHFDTATLLEFGSGPDGEPRTVGVGISPGDDDRPEPYLYVAPWPRPEHAPDHELPAGCWQEIGWVGAVLPGKELVEGSGAEQEARARAFVDAALAKARELLP